MGWPVMGADAARPRGPMYPARRPIDLAVRHTRRPVAPSTGSRDTCPASRRTPGRHRAIARRHRRSKKPFPPTRLLDPLLALGHPLVSWESRQAPSPKPRGRRLGRARDALALSRPRQAGSVPSEDGDIARRTVSASGGHRPCAVGARNAQSASIRLAPDDARGRAAGALILGQRDPRQSVRPRAAQASPPGEVDTVASEASDPPRQGRPPRPRARRRPWPPGRKACRGSCTRSTRRTRERARSRRRPS